jgi:hypothetical protein
LRAAKPAGPPAAAIVPRHDRNGLQTQLDATDTGAKRTWFGDRPVDASEKPGLVRGVFDSVARATT